MARPRRARYGLTEAQLRELCSEMHTILYGTHFASDEERRQAWFDHRAEIRAFYRRTYLKPEYGHQEPEPRAFYAYEAPEGKRDPYDCPPSWRGVRAGVGPPLPEKT